MKASEIFKNFEEEEACGIYTVDEETAIIHKKVASSFVDAEDFEEHSKECVLEDYESLRLFHCFDGESWEEIGGNYPIDYRINYVQDYYSMVVPVIEGKTRWELWSFAPMWAGKPLDGSLNDLWDTYTVPVRQKRVALEKSRRFSGSPSMRVAIM